MSLYLRILLQMVGQAWIKTIAHTATLALLPILTYIITSVISGNIALSLGMVGALSIVRFRNPVRSPLELSVYFAAITMGIAAAVSMKWLVILVSSVTLVALTLYVVNLLVKSLTGKPFFITSFSEGNALSTLLVVAKEKITSLDVDDTLTSKMRTESEVTYTLASADFERLKNIEASIAQVEIITSVQLNR
ncbi:DUF4956 domain-containing protein [Gammaproteobacteria bacterium]|nr:DUF4956 domain-containing protein [Gammaproteobacteria bacterium]